MLWDEDAQKMMMALWNDEGLSASDIASRLSKHFGKDLTRNSVVAKAWRLRAQGVHMRGRGVIPAGRKKKPPRGKLPRTLRKPVAPKAPPRSQLEMAMRVVPFRPKEDNVQPTIFDLAHLEAHHCRWPIGDIREPGFGYCGQDRFMSLPYCAHHCRIGYQTPQVNPRAPAEPKPAMSTRMLEEA